VKRLTVLLALALAGCASGHAAGGGRPWGNTYLSTGVVADGGRALVAGTRIELRFGTDGRLLATAGCNHLGAEADLDDGRLVVGELEMTMMGCDPPRAEQDTWLSAFLRSRPALRLTGDELVLDGGGTRITLTDREVADPDRSLAGPEWVLDTLVSGQVAASVPAGVRVTLTFGGDGRLTGSIGCNTLSGSYTAAAGRITFTGVGATEMACSGERGRIEQAVTAVLRDTVTFTIEAGRLTLTAPDGTGLGLRTA
jgi:heat shock protein HslJ